MRIAYAIAQIRTLLIHKCMDWRTLAFDWNNARAFLAVAEEGSFSAAARALGLTQPTIGRQVAALEAELDVLLFNRSGRSLLLTTAGAELLAYVRVMGDAAGNASLRAAGQSEEMAGPVTITAGDVASAYFLPAILAELRDKAPSIIPAVVSSNDIQDLRRREADIAIRNVRPTEPELVARRMKDSWARCYASDAFERQFGPITTIDDVPDRSFIAFRPVDMFLRELSKRGLDLNERHIGASANSGTVIMNMVQQGLGISVLSTEMAALVPGLRPVLPGVPGFPIETWLIAHQELYTSKRIRFVFDFLAKSLG